MPEYSPFLNPIEEVFSLVKHFIKKLFYSSEISLKDAIVLGFNQLSKNYINKFILSETREFGLNHIDHIAIYKLMGPRHLILRIILYTLETIILTRKLPCY